MSDDANPDALRLDKWLWFARLCKTRSLAQKLIERGQVTLNGTCVQKAGASVGRGDTVTVLLGAVKRTMTVRDLGTRRGPAAEARLLYEHVRPPEQVPAEEAALPLRLGGRRR